MFLFMQKVQCSREQTYLSNWIQVGIKTLEWEMQDRQLITVQQSNFKTEKPEKANVYLDISVIL